MVKKFGELNVGDTFRMTGAWLQGHSEWLFEKIVPNTEYNSHKTDDQTLIDNWCFEDDFEIEWVEDLVYCAACSKPILGNEYDDRHWGHEEDCPNKDEEDNNVECRCNLEYHAQCCPDCKLEYV